MNEEKSLHHILKALERESFGIQEEAKKFSGYWMDYDGLDCMPLDVQVRHHKSMTAKFGRMTTDIIFEFDGNDPESQAVISDIQEFFSSAASAIRGVIAPTKSRKNIKILKQTKESQPITILIHGFYPTTISTEGDVIGKDTWRIEGTCDYYELI